MLDDSTEFIGLVNTVTEIAMSDELTELVELLTTSHISVKQTGYDNWNGGTCIYTIYFVIDIKTFIKLKERLSSIEESLLERFNLGIRHLDNEQLSRISIVPKSYSTATPSPDPDRPFTLAETKRRNELAGYLNNTTEDDLIAEILLPLFRQLGFHRITAAGHKDKALEYGKDIWMKYTLPTQHVLYFGIQVKKGKLDAAGISKPNQMNISEIHHQALMMLGHEIFDPEISRKVLVDHAFIVAGGEITKAARNWIGSQLDIAKRSQIMFMDRDDIINLFIVTNLPLPQGALLKTKPIDDLPF